MAVSIGAAVDRCATRRTVVAALVGVVGCVAGLAWRQSRLAGLDLLDGRGRYTPEEAADPFDALDQFDASARAVYAATALTIDMVFPASYGLLFAVLLFRLFRGGARLYLLPLAVALADALENITVAVLALSHDGAPSPRRRGALAMGPHTTPALTNDSTAAPRRSARVLALSALSGAPLVEEAQQPGRCPPVADGHVLVLRGAGDPAHPALRQPLAEAREVEHPGAGPCLVDAVAQLDGSQSLTVRQRRLQEDHIGVMYVGRSAEPVGCWAFRGRGR